MDITTITLETADPAGTQVFHDKASGPGDWLGVRSSTAPTHGFRGFTLSLLVSQPGTVDELVGTALDAGATALKPATKSFGSKYVEFASSPRKLALYTRRAAAKDAGVSPEGSGSHRLVIGGSASFTDPDGFVWEAADAE